jgi:hypothetical protein
MAFGQYVMQNGLVMVSYGHTHIPISCAQYKANGYKPALEKLAVKSPAAHKSKVCPEPAHSRDNQLAH